MYVQDNYYSTSSEQTDELFDGVFLFQQDESRNYIADSDYLLPLSLDGSFHSDITINEK